MTALTALVLACSLKPSPAPSSSEQLGREVLAALGECDVTGELVRVVDRGVKFGVSTDEGDGDGWPAIREKILAAEIIVLATPIWMGQPSAVAKMTLERLDSVGTVLRCKNASDRDAVDVTPDDRVDDVPRELAVALTRIQLEPTGHRTEDTLY